MQLETRIHAAPGQVSTDIGGQVVILHGATGRYFLLDDVGASIWRMLDQPRTLRDLIDAVLQVYEVDREQCEADLRALLESLLARRLIETVDQ